VSEPAHRFFAAAPRGIAPLLSAELRDLGCVEVDRTGAGASFRGELIDGYRAVLWSRLASRVLLQLARVDASTAESLYEGIRDLPWEDHLRPDGSLAVSFHGTSPQIRNSHFGALKVKDAVVDRFRERSGGRPSVDRERPDVLIDVHLYRGGAVVGLDLSGGGLHRRGYRMETTEAPLRETLAAAVLARADWAQIAREGGDLIDPMCGSGTLLIEAAWIARDRAPALEREDLGLTRWLGHDEAAWDSLRAEAHQRAVAGAASKADIRGYDIDPRAVRAIHANLERAGLTGVVHVERRALADGVPTRGRTGLLVTNPPYGQRLGGESSVRALHAELASRLRADCGGWRAAVLTTTPEWARSFGLRALPEVLPNGALECRLLLGTVPGGEAPAGVGPAEGSAATTTRPPAPGESGGGQDAPAAATRGAGGARNVQGRTPGHTGSEPSPDVAAAEPRAGGGDGRAARDRPATERRAGDGARHRDAPTDGRSTAGGSVRPTAATSSEGAQMFANRLRKNLRTVGKWARRQGIASYRLYDADMPEYALAIDVYHCTGPGEAATRAHVQEYRAPAGIDPGKAAQRLQEALGAIPEVLEIPMSHLHFKVRERKRGSSQYQRRGGEGGAFHEVTEGPCTFLVNFTDYLDTGLFLDHRPTRTMIGEMAAGTRFLNLFAYTGTATVHAALGGARSTTTVDMSQTYLDWAIRNFERNRLSGSSNRVEQADCLRWLAHPRRERWDLIFLDPPTFSNSKRMEADSFDVQRDHAKIIHQAGKLLADDGVLLFSTNFRRFVLDEGGLTGWQYEDITRQTLPKDFERNPRIHRCYRFTRR
jgi:23S rRNA (guanine2445-N2)-methyltransferase / 23S rRNA (guanine2069-N7)-methyltransferase